MTILLSQVVPEGTLAETLFQSYLWHVLPPSLRIAQAIQDNLGASVQEAWDNFIQTGQVWALLIGFVVGYVFRSLTSY